MADNIVARDLMRPSFIRLGRQHLLRETMGIVLDQLRRRETARVLIVLDPDGSYAGALTTRGLLKALLPEWMQDEEVDPAAEDFEARLLEAMRERLDWSVDRVMDRDKPTVGPETRLPRLIEIMRDGRLDAMPVLDKGRVLGVIYLSDVFNAAAGLALSAQQEGAAHE